MTSAQTIAAEVCPGWRCRIAGPVRWAVGGLLLLAASLKAYQLATIPFSGNQLFTSRTFISALVPIEALLGLWLISGVFPRIVRIIALLGFLAFAGYSLHIALWGWRSCGCFGGVTVSPWITFWIDLIVIVLLCLSRPVIARAFGVQLGVFAAILAVALATAALTFGPLNPFGGNGRSLSCANPHFNFGVINGQLLEKHVFELVNNSAHAIRITRVTTSCGCTVAFPPKAPIPPGQSAPLKVLCDWTAVSGPQRVEIDVRSDDPAAGRMLLDVRADVRSEQKPE